MKPTVLVYVADVAPAMFVPFRFHWYVGLSAPETLELKTIEAPESGFESDTEIVTEGGVYLPPARV
jgi:hypothetical protein